MVADPRATALGHAERVLQVRSDGEQRARRGDRQRERAGHVAARAPDEQRATADGARDRVVGARLDRPVVGEERVGDAGEPFQRVVVAEGDRLVGDVAAGQHERRAHVAEQQVMQRRVGEHHPEVGRARRHGRRHRRIRAPRREHDRSARRAQQLARPVVERDKCLGRLKVWRHHGERPLLAVLARAQRGDRVLVGGQARQVIAADALHGDDRAALKQRRGGGDRVALAASAPTSRTAGPHAGHAFGWAWKRRSEGSSYSAWQAAHIANRPSSCWAGRRGPAHDGERGPQSVQLMNG